MYKIEQKQGDKLVTVGYAQSASEADERREEIEFDGGKAVITELDYEAADEVRRKLVEREPLEQMRARSKTQPGEWHSYQNVDLSSEACGDRRYLVVGPQCSFKEPPKTYPDTQFGFGYRYFHEGKVDLKSGLVLPK